MRRYRRILVAVDGSGSSRNAFAQACKIARLNRCWLAAVTVVPDYKDQFQTPGIHDKMDRLLRKEGEDILADIESLSEKENVSVRTILLEGNPVEALVAAAEEGRYDLVVMGKNGNGMFERVLMGSVTAGTVGGSDKDVLVVPEDSSLEWGRVLFCTDGSVYSETAMERAFDFAKYMGSEVSAVSVVSYTDEFYAQAPEVVDKIVEKAIASMESLKRRAEDKGVKVATFVKEGEPHSKILEVAAQEKSDIIIMGSHGRTGLGRFLIGSVAEKVIGYATCPVLVVKNSEG